MPSCSLGTLAHVIRGNPCGGSADHRNPDVWLRSASLVRFAAVSAETCSPIFPFSKPGGGWVRRFLRRPLLLTSLASAERLHCFCDRLPPLELRFAPGSRTVYHPSVRHGFFCCVSSPPYTSDA